MGKQHRESLHNTQDSSTHSTPALNTCRAFARNEGHSAHVVIFSVVSILWGSATVLLDTGHALVSVARLAIAEVVVPVLVRAVVLACTLLALEHVALVAWTLDHSSASLCVRLWIIKDDARLRTARIK